MGRDTARRICRAPAASTGCSLRPKGITSATLYIDGVGYAMSKNGGGGSYSADTNVGFDGSQSVSVTYFGANDRRSSSCRTATPGRRRRAARPAVTRPVVTRRAATRPVVTRPAVTRPVVIRPAVTRRAATRPAVTRRAATRPAVAPRVAAARPAEAQAEARPAAPRAPRRAASFRSRGSRSGSRSSWPEPSSRAARSSCAARRTRSRNRGRRTRLRNGAAARPPRFVRPSGGPCIRRLECKNGSSRAAPDRAAISVFILVTIVSVVVWNLPSSALKEDALAVTGPYIRATGLNQNWGVFSPNPRRHSMFLFARVRYADGSEELSRLPAAAASSAATGITGGGSGPSGRAPTSTASSGSPRPPGSPVAPALRVASPSA